MRKLGLLAAMIAAAVFTGAAKADVSGLTASAGSNSVTVSGTESDLGGCLVSVELIDAATGGLVFDQGNLVALDLSGDFTITFPGQPTIGGTSSEITPNTAYTIQVDDSGCGPNGSLTSFGILTPGLAERRAPDGVFLCYSKFQIDPGVWTADLAQSLRKSGYWVPYAVAGILAGGTNTGGNHLVCNLVGNQKPLGGYVDNSGGRYASAADPDQQGIYPRAG